MAIRVCHPRQLIAVALLLIFQPISNAFAIQPPTSVLTSSLPISALRTPPKRSISPLPPSLHCRGAATTSIPTSLHSTTTATSSSPLKSIKFKYKTKKVNGASDILNVASFRNDCTSPELMVARAEAKRDNMDPTKAALGGIKIGLIVGSILGVTAGYFEGSFQKGLEYFEVGGGTMSVFLVIQALSGNKIYVPTLPEAVNRLEVDYVSFLKAGQDVGFVAVVNDDRVNDGKYIPTNGVFACVDCQVKEDRKVKGLPRHVYIKNMKVDDGMRRRGVGKSLIDSVVGYAKKEGVDTVALEVDDSNTGAVKLYERAGFVTRKDLQGNIWGRSIMVKGSI